MDLETGMVSWIMRTCAAWKRKWGVIPMPISQELELAASAYKIARDLVNVQEGESVLITVDSAGEWRAAEETAKAAESLGAKVAVAYHSTPPGYGKVGDAGLPDSVAAAIPNTDAWIEFNNQWLLYSTPWETAMAGSRVRYLFLGGLNVDQVVRCIGKVDLKAQTAFQNTIVEMTRNARRMRVTNEAGTDIRFENDSKRPLINELTAQTPGPHFLIGQVGWAPIEETIEGDIVFDGSFSGGGEADLGILDDPIKLVVRKGRIEDVVGGESAQKLSNWLKKLDDDRMYNMAHICYGFNPGARLSGLCTEDERVWGSTEWGFGYQGPMFDGAFRDAVSHADGICLKSTVWMDDRLIVRDGEVVEEKLAALARACGK